MANVLHRIIFKYLPSVNTPDYPEGTWVVNPDMSPVEGVPTKYWKLTGDVLSVMDQAEKDAVDDALLPAYKQAKMDQIDTRTGELILEGFEYPVSSGVVFSLSPESQCSLNSANSNRDDLTYPIEWDSRDNLSTIVLADAPELHDFAVAGTNTVVKHRKSGHVLKQSVIAAVDAAGVDAVVDSR